MGHNPAMIFHNGLRILMGLDAHELIESGVCADAIESARFMADPFMAAIRLSDAAYDNLWALMVERGMRA